MKFVNEYFIKNSLNTMFWPIRNYFCANHNDTLIELFKKKVKNQNKPTQIGIYIVSFIFTTIVTNAIKTYAADVTQNQGDWKKAWAQFKETFPKWGMVLSALGVTSSDLYNLTTKMKPVLKLIYKEKEEQKIIDEVLSRLPNMINTVNGNGVNHEHAPIIRRENVTSNSYNLNADIVHEINDLDTESLVVHPTNSNQNHSNKFCTIM